MAPLKTYANVTGMLALKQELDEKVHEKVRNRTIEAERQRTERKTIMLSAPPADVSKPTKGKKKDAAAVRRPANPTSSYASTSARPPPPPSPHSHSNSASGETSSAKSRLIHCLALEPRTSEQIVNMCAGKEASSRSKQELKQLLQAVSIAFRALYASVPILYVFSRLRRLSRRAGTAMRLNHASGS